MKINHDHRHAGVLLHISSLPQGDLGPDAFRFVDFLASAGVSVWQTLPLNMTHADGSPYQCLSAHAGNPNFISLAQLCEWDWLSLQEISIVQDRNALLMLAYQAFQQKNHPEEQVRFDQFCKQQAYWLDDFSLYITLRKVYAQQSWAVWPQALKLREASAINEFKVLFKNEIYFNKFIQFIFFEQWQALKNYANTRDIALFGDIPIFVSYDSADVWSNPNMFKLDENLEMTVVAGVPPDYFSETGQRWGNPHYNWDVMQADGFSWWLARLKTQQAMFDMIRIDHFRGLEAAWEIVGTEPTAINGTWVKAPGDELLKVIHAQLPDMTLVAEDLGIITDEVNLLRNTYDLPGMKILQFAFDGGEDNPYLPENIEINSVVYTGTHDNDTSLGWYQTLNEAQKDRLATYFEQHHIPDSMPQALVKLALMTQAKLAVIPMQDILGLDGDARMNTPGTIDHNWQWRFQWSQLLAPLVQKFFEDIILTNRYQTQADHVT